MPAGDESLQFERARQHRTAGRRAASGSTSTPTTTTASTSTCTGTRCARAAATTAAPLPAARATRARRTTTATCFSRRSRRLSRATAGSASRSAPRPTASGTSDGELAVLDRRSARRRLPPRHPERHVAARAVPHRRLQFSACTPPAPFEGFDFRSATEVGFKSIFLDAYYERDTSAAKRAVLEGPRPRPSATSRRFSTTTSWPRPSASAAPADRPGRALPAVTHRECATSPARTRTAAPRRPKPARRTRAARPG